MCTPYIWHWHRIYCTFSKWFFLDPAVTVNFKIPWFNHASTDFIALCLFIKNTQNSVTASGNLLINYRPRAVIKKSPEERVHKKKGNTT